MAKQSVQGDLQIHTFGTGASSPNTALPWGGYGPYTSTPNITWQTTTSGATYASASSVLSNT